MIHDDQENEHLTNNMVIVFVSMLLGGLAGVLTLLLPAR